MLTSGLQDKSLDANKQRHTLVHVSPHPPRFRSYLHRPRISLRSVLSPESRQRAVFTLTRGARRLYAGIRKARTRRGVRRGGASEYRSASGTTCASIAVRYSRQGPFNGEREHSGGGSLLSPNKASVMRNSSYGREKD